MYVGKTTDRELRSYETDRDTDQCKDRKMTYSTDSDQQRQQSNCLAGGSRASAAARRLGTVVRMEDVQGDDHADDQGDGNHEGGFGYSQKFFHISDGNLYSVFSPLQGRSYGVKPSFLRKHRCTVQETKGKKGGRRNARRGLKFHNFIPSESITSEREEAGQATQRKQGGKDKCQSAQGSSADAGQPPSGEVWKVHAECRLREEHGTKQIMVSNWSLSSDSPAMPSNSKPTNVQTTYKNCTKEQDIVAEVVPKTEAIVQLHAKTEHKQNSKPSVLQQYLEYGKMLPESDIGVTSIDDKVKRERLEFNQDGDDSKKHRRKPTTTRRVVPYVKYLTMVDDGPLDLSRQKDIEPIEDLHTRTTPYLNLTQRLSSKSPVQPPTSNPPSRSFVPEPQEHPNLPQGYLSLPDSHHLATQPNAETGRPRRKPSQRTIIRQKLEDTFKQNGFLVKTKQVSDGDATFCKFKQLRKYTRYYLKSWHQHLPDEVHKLWKGFLPPKTTLSNQPKPHNQEQEDGSVELRNNEPTTPSN